MEVKEIYCSKEVCELLRERGFNEDCYTYYDDIDTSINRFDKGYHFNNTSFPWGVPYDVSQARKYIVAPTHQMACAWIRKKGYSIEVHATPVGWHWDVCKVNGTLIASGGSISYTNDNMSTSSYDKCTEDALKYILTYIL